MALLQTKHEGDEDQHCAHQVILSVNLRNRTFARINCI
jgi:hypothetical protein